MAWAMIFVSRLESRSRQVRVVRAAAVGSDGLAEAFLLAGAKSVVGALWDVDDSATEALMKDFYRHLAEGEDKSTALRQAKLDYLKRWGDLSPSFWAAFTLVGDGSTPITF